MQASAPPRVPEGIPHEDPGLFNEYAEAVEFAPGLLSTPLSGTELGQDMYQADRQGNRYRSIRPGAAGVVAAGSAPVTGDLVPVCPGQGTRRLTVEEARGILLVAVAVPLVKGSGMPVHAPLLALVAGAQVGEDERCCRGCVNQVGVCVGGGRIAGTQRGPVHLVGGIFSIRPWLL